MLCCACSKIKRVPEFLCVFEGGGGGGGLTSLDGKRAAFSLSRTMTAALTDVRRLWGVWTIVANADSNVFLKAQCGQHQQHWDNNDQQPTVLSQAMICTTNCLLGRLYLSYLLVDEPSKRAMAYVLQDNDDTVTTATWLSLVEGYM